MPAGLLAKMAPRGPACHPAGLHLLQWSSTAARWAGRAPPPPTPPPARPPPPPPLTTTPTTPHPTPPPTPTHPTHTGLLMCRFAAPLAFNFMAAIALPESKDHDAPDVTDTVFYAEFGQLMMRQPLVRRAGHRRMWRSHACCCPAAWLLLVTTSSRTAGVAGPRPALPGLCCRRLAGSSPRLPRRCWSRTCCCWPGGLGSGGVASEGGCCCWEEGGASGQRTLALPTPSRRRRPACPGPPPPLTGGCPPRGLLFKGGTTFGGGGGGREGTPLGVSWRDGGEPACARFSYSRALTQAHLCPLVSPFENERRSPPQQNKSMHLHTPNKLLNQTGQPRCPQLQFEDGWQDDKGAPAQNGAAATPSARPAPAPLQFEDDWQNDSYAAMGRRLLAVESGARRVSLCGPERNASLPLLRCSHRSGVAAAPCVQPPAENARNGLPPGLTIEPAAAGGAPPPASAGAGLLGGLREAAAAAAVEQAAEEAAARRGGSWWARLLPGGAPAGGGGGGGDGGAQQRSVEAARGRLTRLLIPTGGAGEAGGRRGAGYTALPSSAADASPLVRTAPGGIGGGGRHVCGVSAGGAGDAPPGASAHSPAHGGAGMKAWRAQYLASTAAAGPSGGAAAGGRSSQARRGSVDVEHSQT